jgi:PIN domain nuclease of toxin-antitoxin system
MGQRERSVMLFLDTHIVIWLYTMQLSLISPKAQKLIAENDVFISPAVFLEMEYLFEIGKISEKAKTITAFLAKKIDLKIDDEYFLNIIHVAAEEKWTRDPFDRIIVSHAKCRDASLISKDGQIKKHYKKTIF